MAKTDTRNEGQSPLFPDDNDLRFEPDRDSPWASHLAYQVILANSRFRLKPLPKDKAFATSLVLEAMVAFQHMRQEWMPSLAHFHEPFCFDLPRGTRCAFQLWTTAEDVDFVGAHYWATDELAIHLPKPQRWTKLSLDWLAVPKCHCGSYDCSPMPFRRRQCPNETSSATASMPTITMNWGQR